MLKLVALGCAILTFFMGVLHIMLSIGFPIGEYVLGGKNKIIPFQFSDIISKIIMILYSLFLAYAIIGNIFFTKSKKEKIIMIPASAIGFICSFFTLLLSW